jgi:hypothetical protein
MYKENSGNPVVDQHSTRPVIYICKKRHFVGLFKAFWLKSHQMKYQRLNWK